MNPSEIDQCLPLISVSGTILVQKYLEWFVRPQTLGGPKTPHILQNGEIGFHSLWKIAFRAIVSKSEHLRVDDASQQ